MASVMLAVLAALASFFVLFLLLAFLFCVCKRPPSSSRDHHQIRNRSARRRELTSIVVDESASFDPSLRFSMLDLKKATKNFSSDLIVGDGSFGLVYKAQLSTGDIVAIKKLDPDAFQGFREFRAEMETLGKLRHRNIVKILGFCISGSDRLLIYEFMEKGSLDMCLYDTSSSEQSDNSIVRLPLSWAVRVNIVKGVANGLAFLHGLEKPIIHRDIKASNVLLDSDFEAHISDFGLARRIDTSNSHVSTQMAGTMGYMPPEYKDGHTAATPKVDVYSFGILMFEIATGRRPNWPTKMEGKEMGLVDWAGRMVAQKREMEIVDSSIRRGGDGVKEGSVVEYFKIARMCTAEKYKERPLMYEVVELLEGI